MPEWKVAARLDSERWVAWDGAEWTADPATTRIFQTLPRGPYGPVPMTPVGPVYTPRNTADPVAVFLHAAAALPGGLIVDGAPPDLPMIPPAPEGAVA